MRQEMTGFWDAMASAGPHANNLHLASDRLTTPTTHHSSFTGRMLFLTPNQQCQSTEGLKAKTKQIFGEVIVIQNVQFAVENYTTQYNIILTVNLWPQPLLGLVK